MATKMVNGVEVTLTSQEEADLNAAIADLDSVLAANQYKFERAAAYPQLGDQLDMLWHAIDNGDPLDQTSDFYTTIKSIKDTYPKPN